MEQNLIKQLTNLKTTTTKIGHQYISSLLPLPLNDMNKHLKPFVTMERACDDAIKLLQK